MATLLQIVLLTLSFCGLGMAESLKTVKAVHVNYENVEDLASFMHSSGSIIGNYIHFERGSAREKLLEVPIGYVSPRDTIVVTVGLEKDHVNVPGEDVDPTVGISDGAGDFNVFKIHDVNNYNKWTPCKVRDGEDENRLVSDGTPVSATFKLTFIPSRGFGSCETAQDSGYMNTGIFNQRLDFTEPFYLRVNRDNGHEEYYYVYFLVEIISP